jgi:ATPase family associated with various cellular activities (AAA)
MSVSSRKLGAQASSRAAAAREHAYEPLARNCPGLFAATRISAMKHHLFRFDDEDFPGTRGLPLHIALRGDLADLGDTLLKVRALRAFDCGARRFSIYRNLRFAVRRELDELLDDLALRSGYLAQRLDGNSLLLDGPGMFVSIHGRLKGDYISGAIDIWSESLERLEAVRRSLLDIVGEQQVKAAMFTIDWHFLSPRMGLTSVVFEEIADPDLMDEAYPILTGGVSAFIDRYIVARETVLILQGPPGTGKTRLVRAILAALSRRRNDSAKVLYTADKRALENDEIFVEFLTGEHAAFVVEDADHLLGARSNGNVDLHRFLTVADGVVRAQGRKIIFTTNLVNIGDIDDALLRPGRCFATVRTRGLTPKEAARLIERVVVSDDARRQEVLGRAIPDGARCVTLADLFRAIEASTSNS